MASGINIRIGATNATGSVFKSVTGGIDRLGSSVKSIGASFTRLGAGATAAGAAIAGPLAAAVASFGAAGDTLDKMAKRTGLAVEGLSELAFAAEQSGADLGSVEKGIKGMQRALFDAASGSAEITRAFDELGVTSEQLTGMLPEDQFTLLAGKIGEIEDPSLKAAVAMKIFGKAGAELIPLMNEGVDGISKLREEAGELGRSMSTEDAAAAAEYTDAMNRLKSVLVGLKNQIGSALAPTITGLVNRIVAGTRGVVAFVQNNKHLVVTLGAVGVGITALGGVLLTLGGTLTVLGVAISGVSAAITALGAVASVVLSPIGLAVAAIAIPLAALGAGLIVLGVQTGLFSDAFEHAKVILGNFWETAQETFGGISDALKSGDWALAANIAWAGVKLAFWEGLGDILMAFAQMVPKMWDIMKQLFVKILEAAWETAKVTAEVIVSPAGAALKAGNLVSKLSNINIGGGEGGFIKGKTDAARVELETLKREASEKVAQNTERTTAAVNNVEKGVEKVAAILESMKQNPADALRVEVVK